jgi:predicted RNA-binding Zn-ribbon protein involved in translation (DUF1610 family)
MCIECGGEMVFDDEEWAYICSQCGDAIELEPGEEPEQFDLSEDDDY